MLPSLDEVYSLLSPRRYRLVVYGDIAAMVVDGVELPEGVEEHLYCVEAGGEKHCYGEVDEVMVFATGARLVLFTEVDW